MKKRGGKRPNAGRKKLVYATKRITIPVDCEIEIKNILIKWLEIKKKVLYL